MVLANSPSMMYLAFLFLTLEVIWEQRGIQGGEGGAWQLAAAVCPGAFPLPGTPHPVGNPQQQLGLWDDTCTHAETCLLTQSRAFFKSYLLFPKALNCSCSQHLQMINCIMSEIIRAAFSLGYFCLQLSGHARGFCWVSQDYRMKSVFTAPDIIQH